MKNQLTLLFLTFLLCSCGVNKRAWNGPSSQMGDRLRTQLAEVQPYAPQAQPRPASKRLTGGRWVEWWDCWDGQGMQPFEPGSNPGGIYHGTTFLYNDLYDN